MLIKGIARYPHLLNPSSSKNVDKLKYSVNLLIHKLDSKLPQLTKKINEAIANGFPKGTPDDFYNCLTDLAVTDPTNDALKEYMCLKASSNAEFEKPHIVDNDLNPIIDPTFRITGKCVWIDGSPGTFNKGSNGVSFYLNATKVTNEEGPIPSDSISSKPSIEQIFEGIDDESSPIAPTTPTTPTTPAPPAPPVPSPVVEEKYQMTYKANGMTRDQFIAQGWSDAQLISEGYLSPPNGVTPSFS